MTEMLPLEEAIGLELGFPFKSGTFNTDGTGLPLVRIRDVVRGFSNTYYDGSVDSRYLIANGDYLIGMDGEFNVGRWRGGKAILNQRVAKLGEPRHGVDKDYVARFLPAALKAIEDQTPFATVKHLSAKKLRAIMIPLPPLKEQYRIAAILDKADALRAKRRQVLTKSDALVSAIFLDIFGDPIKNAALWPSKQIDEICRIVRGSSPRPQGDPRFFGGDVPRLMISDITRDGKWVTPTTDSLTEAGALRSRPCPRGTIVMAVSGNIGLVSRLAVDACIHDGFVGFLDLHEEIFLPDFLLEVLNLSRRMHTRNAAGAIFQNITTTDIKRMQVIMPPIDLQMEFLRRVDQVTKATDRQLAGTKQLDSLFAAVQARAFRGEL
ncbi:restriction endonuclease subunit S [Rhodococcus sp. 05-339-2]|uniref:restriction endonuclease subunit S n=1 Tax=Rhodococcoides fascians TaxID=1828 RepID=UPI00068CACA3|nr:MULTISPECIES: restriction endonuclease subunit S [Rhodococcus]OZD85581.1 restriction endonuclease subunit S [Rhodococcus sp. 05-339-2]